MLYVFICHHYKLLTYTIPYNYLLIVYHCVKIMMSLQPSYLTFSKVNKELCYVAGFDNSEFKCGNFIDQKQQRKGRGHGLYADNRWIGMTKIVDSHNSTTTASDTIIGMSMNGTLYVIDHPYMMAPSSADFETTTNDKNVANDD